MLWRAALNKLSLRIYMKSNNQNDVQHQEEQEEIMDIEQMEQELEEMQTTDLEQCQQDAAMWKDQAARILIITKNVWKEIRLRGCKQRKYRF
jgi:hypothetical protein